MSGFSSHEDGMPAKSSRDPARCRGTRCLISSNAHKVSESKPPANYTQKRDHQNNCECNKWWNYTANLHIRRVYGFNLWSVLMTRFWSFTSYSFTALKVLEKSKLMTKKLHKVATKITWWALYAKCTPCSSRVSWLDSLSEFRMVSSSIVSLFMYILKRVIEACFICIYSV